MPFSKPIYKNKKNGKKDAVVNKDTFKNVFVFFIESNEIKNGTNAKKETKE